MRRSVSGVTRAGLVVGALERWPITLNAASAMAVNTRAGRLLKIIAPSCSFEDQCTLLLLSAIAQPRHEPSPGMPTEKPSHRTSRCARLLPGQECSLSR